MEHSSEITVALASLAVISQVIILFTAVIGLLRTLSAVRDVHLSLNSRLDQLISSVGDTRFAEGRSQGAREERLLLGTLGSTKEQRGEKIPGSPGGSE